MLVLDIITLPNATATLTDIGEWSSPIVNEFWTLAMFIVGIFLGFMILRFVGSAIIGAFSTYILGKKSESDDKFSSITEANFISLKK